MDRQATIKKLKDQLKELDDKAPRGLLAYPEDHQQLRERELLTTAIAAEQEAMRLEAESSRQKEYAESMAKAAMAIAQQNEDQDNGLISLNHLVGELAKIGELDFRTNDYKVRAEEARQQVTDAIAAKQLTPRKRSTLFPIKSLKTPWPIDAVVREDEVIGWLRETGAKLPTRFDNSFNVKAVLPSDPKKPEILKCNALVREFSRIWPSINRDLKDKTRHANDLLHKANVWRGHYDVEMALTWAKTEGKITKDKATSYVSATTNSIFAAMIGQIYNLN